MTMRSIAWALAPSAFRMCRARSAIHDLCAYFAFVNRIADGLGVELERLQP